MLNRMSANFGDVAFRKKTHLSWTLQNGILTCIATRRKTLQIGRISNLPFKQSEGALL